jgi:hypothetical protein
MAGTTTKSKREIVLLNDVICMWDNARSINQFGRYDMTVLASPEQLRELDRKVKGLVKEKEFPEYVVVTYKLPSGKEMQALDEDGKPIHQKGYNVPWRDPNDIELTNAPEINDLLVVKAGSKFAPKAFVKDTPVAAPRTMEVTDAEIEGRGTIVSIAVGLNVYDTKKDDKRFCGVSLYLQQILYTGVPCGFSLGEGGSGTCAWG